MSLSNKFVASFRKDEVFNLQTFTFAPLPHDHEAGTVLRLIGGEYTESTIDEADRVMLTADPALKQVLNEIVKAECTGMIVYDVAWWAMPFNTFMYGFCDRHFEV